MDSVAINDVDGDATAAETVPSTRLAPWSQRVRWIGGLIQTAFAAYWLARGSVVIGGAAAYALLVVCELSAIGVFVHAIRGAAGAAPRPKGSEARRIERQVTVASGLEFGAAIVLPVLVSAAGHPDWVLPSVAVTVGPLLLWLDYRVSVPRYRPVGWALTIGPVILITVLSGTPLVATTGLGAGVLLLGTALAGFRDLTRARRVAENPSAMSAAAPASTEVAA